MERADLADEGPTSPPAAPPAPDPAASDFATTGDEHDHQSDAHSDLHSDAHDDVLEVDESPSDPNLIGVDSNDTLTRLLDKLDGLEIGSRIERVGHGWELFLVVPKTIAKIHGSGPTLLAAFDSIGK